jgi:hypothetical protein
MNRRKPGAALAGLMGVWARLRRLGPRHSWLLRGLGLLVLAAAVYLALVQLPPASAAEKHARSSSPLEWAGFRALDPIVVTLDSDASSMWFLHGRAPWVGQRGDSFGPVGLMLARSEGSRTGPLWFDAYLHRPGGAMADPINLIFVGGSPARAARAMRRVTGWATLSGSSMAFLDQGHLHKPAYQLGRYLADGSRYHLRIESTRGDSGQAYVLAAAHHDAISRCGHVGRDFDLARDIVAKDFRAADYSVTYVRLDNTRPSLQCDGSYSAGDGYAALIRLDKQGNARTQPVSIITRSVH